MGISTCSHPLKLLTKSTPRLSRKLVNAMVTPLLPSYEVSRNDLLHGAAVKGGGGKGIDIARKRESEDRKRQSLIKCGGIRQ